MPRPEPRAATDRIRYGVDRTNPDSSTEIRAMSDLIELFSIDGV